MKTQLRVGRRYLLEFDTGRLMEFEIREKAGSDYYKVTTFSKYVPVTEWMSKEELAEFLRSVRSVREIVREGVILM